MADVRYLGWADRETSRKGDRVTSFPTNLKKRVNLPDGGHIIMRGRAGSPSNWRTVDDRHAIEHFRESDEWEVRE